MDNKLQEKINLIRAESKHNKNVRDEEYRKIKMEFESKNKLCKNLLFPHLRKANVKDYKQWMKGFLENGGEPTHVYNYGFRNETFYVAISNFDFNAIGDGLFGTQAVNIIIPNGINFGGGNSGHCNLYFLKNYTNQGIWIPLFKNINFEN